jgi:alkanesulfonate monooxygenase SsuD/methylene tetrahydromethanopterin reductase-like flavin-dependent oxidoreductase (luciferase family)
VRIGLVTPVVTLNPRSHNAWESDAVPADVVRIARAADELGWHHLTASEHVGIPAAEAAVRGARYWDPLATLSWLAGHTTHIRLATHVLVLGYHHPLQLAKAYGTLALLSGNRVVLGVGVGSLEAEFTLLGKEFRDRGVRADESLVELRAAMDQPVAAGFALDPHQRSLRRALEHGDGWVPFGLQPEEVASMLPAIPDGFEIVLHPPLPVDPLGAAEDLISTARRWQAAGATVLNLRLVHTGVQHCIDQLAECTRLLQQAGLAEVR